MLGSQGFWQHQVLGGWRLAQQEIQCSRSVRQTVLANMLQYSCLENPRQRNLAGYSLQGRKVSDTTGVTLHAKIQDFFFFFFACGSSPVRVEREGGAVAWLVGTLVKPSVQGHGLLPLQELWPISLFFDPLEAGDQKASGQSFSITGLSGT